MKNHFFVIEGGDCCGKSTAATILLDNILNQGREYFSTHALYDHPEGREAYKVMCNREPIDVVRNLMITCHSVLTNDIVKPHLEAGKVVIQDRNWLSALNYQWINHGRNPEDDVELMQGIHEGYKHLKPFVILLDGPDNIIDERLMRKENKDANELESLEFHRNIRKQYRELFKLWQSWGYDGIIINSSTIASVTEAIDALFLPEVLHSGTVSM